LNIIKDNEDIGDIEDEINEDIADDAAEK